tara:strand:- start:1600 stop:2310 length:711 start_codon:yes stop_codon:yes gene_type:complete
MKIACWSGPRNISTALMRSWSSRKNSFVSDEPLYAYYLKEKKLKHPMHKEIINYYPNKYNDIINTLSSEIPFGKKYWYQKHMAHHLINAKNLKWINNFENCILIRNPRLVINSYVKKNNLTNVDELGYPQQLKIIKHLQKNNINYHIIDAETFLENPTKGLKLWCKKLNINFEKNMLQWEKGKHKNDGIWGKHWYSNVYKTESFVKSISKNSNAYLKYDYIYNEAYYIYKKIYNLI